ncbi:MAG: helix-turn-helix transcriptional regulator [Clostridia bacterium]|nr:helix-turn-helix transcriptional regulator [Clostridia bacterium]
MDQSKIGKFIFNCRKEKGLTQEQLGEKLGVTSKSISRWENGKTMPDYSLLKDLCNELDINVNELLSGEKINETDYISKAEENFIMLKEKVDSTLKILNIVKYICTVALVIAFFANMYFNHKYRGPWDDSNLKLIVKIILCVDFPCLILCELLNYKIKK